MIGTHKDQIANASRSLEYWIQSKENGKERPEVADIMIDFEQNWIRICQEIISQYEKALQG
jgi:hypothetical protein